jgi:hypothetical protein
VPVCREVRLVHHLGQAAALAEQVHQGQTLVGAPDCAAAGGAERPARLVLFYGAKAALPLDLARNRV